jgi:NADH dehydrogenase (ubiquinone) Fe-S protein 6
MGCNPFLPAAAVPLPASGGLKRLARLAIRLRMIPPPETIRVSQRRVACDGATDIPGGAALGHPRVFLQIDDEGYVDCGYCDRRFVLIGGPADGADQSKLPDHPDGASV